MTASEARLDAARGGRGGRRAAAVGTLAAVAVLTTGGLAIAASSSAHLDAAARDSGRPRAELRIASRDTIRLTASGTTLDVAKVLDRQGNAYETTFDESGRRVSLQRAQSDDAAARRSRYGKLDPPLHAAVASASPSTRIPVSVWVASNDLEVRRTGDVDADRGRLQAAMATRRAPVANAIRRMGATPIEAVYGPAVFAELTPGQVRRLQARGDIEQVYTAARHVRTADDASTTQRVNSIWALGNLGAGPSSRPVVHEDDGVSDVNPYLNNATHPVIYFCAAVNSICHLGKNRDDHASEVAGAIASTHALHRGIAPNAQLVLSANSQDLDDDPKNVAANEWGAGNGGNPTNMSWGEVCPSGGQTFMSRYLDWAVANLGQTFTVAAGNRRPECPANMQVSGPGHAWSVITVGAYDDNDNGFWNDDTVSSFSRFVDPATGQDKPEVVAVGEGLSLTSFPDDISHGNDGTSFAAPMVAGQVTSMLARQPGQAGWPETNKAAVLASAYRDLEAGSDPDGLGAVVMNNSDATYRLGRFLNLCGTGCTTLKAADFPIERTTSLTRGQRVKVAMAYNSQSTGGGGSDVLGADLDLTVFSPGDVIMCASASSTNAWESCEFTVPVTGVYRFRMTRKSSISGWTGTFAGLAWSARSLPNICSAPMRTFRSTGGILTASTANGPTYFDSYVGWGLLQDGREQVFKYVNTVTQDLTFTDTSPDIDLHAVRFSSCTADPITPTVLAHGANSLTLPSAAPGTYYFIGDGRDGAVATSTFRLLVG